MFPAVADDVLRSYVPSFVQSHLYHTPVHEPHGGQVVPEASKVTVWHICFGDATGESCVKEATGGQHATSVYVPRS